MWICLTKTRKPTLSTRVGQYRSSERQQILNLIHSFGHTSPVASTTRYTYIYMFIRSQGLCFSNDTRRKLFRLKFCCMSQIKCAQVEHHLFPAICHCHYPKIAPIVKKMCAKYGYPYHCYETFWSALLAHFSYLKYVGHGISLPRLGDA